MTDTIVGTAKAQFLGVYVYIGSLSNQPLVHIGVHQEKVKGKTKNYGIAPYMAKAHYAREKINANAIDDTARHVFDGGITVAMLNTYDDKDSWRYFTVSDASGNKVVYENEILATEARNLMLEQYGSMGYHLLTDPSKAKKSKNGEKNGGWGRKTLGQMKKEDIDRLVNRLSFGMHVSNIERMRQAVYYGYIKDKFTDKPSVWQFIALYAKDEDPVKASGY